MLEDEKTSDSGSQLYRLDIGYPTASGPRHLLDNVSLVYPAQKTLLAEVGSIPAGSDRALPASIPLGLSFYALAIYPLFA